MRISDHQFWMQSKESHERVFKIVKEHFTYKWLKWFIFQFEVALLDQFHLLDNKLIGRLAVIW